MGGRYLVWVFHKDVNFVVLFACNCKLFLTNTCFCGQLNLVKPLCLNLKLFVIFPVLKLLKDLSTGIS